MFLTLLMSLGFGKAIIEALGCETSNLGSLQSLVRCIFESIEGKKYLVVLDDVWTDDYTKWEPFQRCLANGQCGNNILVTTHKKTVARMMESTNLISIKELSTQECWSLFKQECWLLFKELAFFDKAFLSV